MPTNTAAVLPTANAMGIRDNSLVVVKNLDLITVIAFSAIGLLLAISFASFFPFSAT
jgi:hypothetical protein